MGVKVKDLDSPLKSFLVDGEVRGATDSEIEDAGGWHQGQEAFLSGGESIDRIQKFLDFLPRRVFLPWILALTAKVNEDGGIVKTLNGDVPKISKRIDELEETTIQKIGEEVERLLESLEPFEDSINRANEVIELATAAAENVMKKDQSASVLDVIKKTPLYFGTGTSEEIEAMMEAAPGEAIYFDETEDAILVNLLAGQLTNYEVKDDGEIDELLIKTIESMQSHGFKRFVLSFTSTDNFSGAGGHYCTEIYKLSTNYAIVTARTYLQGGRTLQRIWVPAEGETNAKLHPWEWHNPRMMPGIEYRTTERYNGLPVYRKLIEYQFDAAVGDFEGHVDTLIPHGISGMTKLLRSSASMNDDAVLPWCGTEGGLTIVNGTDETNVKFRIVKSQWSNPLPKLSIDLAYTKS